MRRLLTFASAVAVAAGALLAATAAPAAAGVTVAGTGPRLITWGSCRSYTDDELKQESHGHDLAALKREIARMECGAVTVPLDYGYPHGRQLRIAVTRLPALDPQNRIGALVINPGGPGESGVLEPPDVALSRAADLAKRFDLIGFDPRGMGDSTPRLQCDPASFPGALTTDQEAARQVSGKLAAANQACAGLDPALTASLTTANVARDVDAIRVGLHERKISYLGFSWGTQLGATYQTLFPDRVARMALDSPVNPDVRQDSWEDDIAAAQDADSRRFVAWLASFDNVYHLGATPDAVNTTLRRIDAFFTAHPQPLPEINNFGDDFTVPLEITNASPSWPANAADLVVMNRIASAPPAVSADTVAPRTPAAEFRNIGVHFSILCNADTGIHDFGPWFDHFQQRLGTFPVAGRIADPAPVCVGWPHPVNPDPTANTGSKVLVVAHRYEVVAPYPWAQLMAQRIGAASLTVDDDVHAGVIDVPCANYVVIFLESGTEQQGDCPGTPLPTP
jgi:pimeloyl-ACP methyl ester carboxylesterase